MGKLLLEDDPRKQKCQHDWVTTNSLPTTEGTTVKTREFTCAKCGLVNTVNVHTESASSGSKLLLG